MSSTEHLPPDVLHSPGYGVSRVRLAIALGAVPFLITFCAVAYLAWQRLFPVLSGKGKQALDFSCKRPSFNLRRVSSSFRSLTQFTSERAAAITFSTTIALSAVLAELIFCEISNIFNPAARGLALQATISVLLVSLVIVTPALEIHSLIRAAGWDFHGSGTTRILFGIFLDSIGLLGWLAAFWWIGRAVLGVHDAEGRPILHESVKAFHDGHGLSQGSLERIGIIGISLMALLAGFAAVSSLWQTFGVRVRKVTETDIRRKEAGLEATTELLAAKQSRLRAVQRKLNDDTKGGFMARLMGSVRGNADMHELAALELEVSGLETMQISLNNALSLLRSRRAAQQSASTPLGRVCTGASYIFSLYCIYRIGATTATTVRRYWSPTATFASTDPINNVLALIAKHWDPSLDRAAWSRQISFLLSGLMLLASFNAVLQTVLLFGRFTPARLLQSAQQNLALLVSQISATYVVSSAIMLRSNLPKEMGSAIEGALGSPLDTVFVERWFEVWFLAACAVTAVGIAVGRGLKGDDVWDDDYWDEGDVELGTGHEKRSS